MRVSSVSGVILAAGPSRRFGASIPKQLYSYKGEALVRRAARTALSSRLAEVIVVVGFEAARVRRALRGLDVEITENPRYQEGQSTSVKQGLARVASGAAAAMFLPCDQPELDRDLIDRLIAGFERSRGSILVPVYSGQRGAPVVFACSLFPELAGIGGDRGGRQLFAAHAEEIVEVPTTGLRPLLDVDRLEDLEALRRPCD